MLRLFLVLVLLGILPGTSEANSTDDAVVQALVDLYPKYLDTETARANVEAARAAIEKAGFEDSTDDLFYLLLGMGYVESRWDGRSVSRVVCTDGDCKRRTGVVGQTRAKTFRGPYFCGVLQVAAKHSWKRCQAFANDLQATYDKGVQELLSWRTMCTRKYKKLSSDELRLERCVLLGHGGGWPLVKRGLAKNPKGRSVSYPRRCKAEARKIRRAADKLLSV